MAEKNKKGFKAAGEDLIFTANKKSNEITNDNLNENKIKISNINSNKNTINVPELFNSIKPNDKLTTRSFYLTDKTYSTLMERAKVNGISASKFLEKLLSELFSKMEE